MGKEESIRCQEEEEDQVRDEVGEEEESSVCPPFVLQQTCHHGVFEEVISFVFHLQQHKRWETVMEIGKYQVKVSIGVTYIAEIHHLSTLHQCAGLLDGH